ncbi:hypothetical protein BH09PSE6_BH09PSE6_06960 [soil metagenome]
MDTTDISPAPPRSRRKRGPSARTVSSVIGLIAGLTVMCVIVFAPMFMHLFPDAWLVWPPYGLFIGLAVGAIVFVLVRRTLFRWLMGA